MFEKSLSIVFRYPRMANQEIVSGEVKNGYHFTTQMIEKSDVSTVISFEEDQKENTIEKIGPRLTVIRIATPKTRGFVRYMRRIISAYLFCRHKLENNYDIVHSHVTYGSILAVILGYRKKLISTPHGTNFQEIQTELGNSPKDLLRKANAQIQRKLDSFAMNASTLNISVSRYQIEDMINSYNCTKPIQVVYNGVPNYYSPNPEKIKSYDGLFIGRACKKKGLDLFYKLACQNPDKKYKMVLGDEIFTTLPKSFMAKLEAAKNIVIAYGRSEIELVNDLNDSQVLIVPSRGYESLPTVIMEAVACGTPVIATEAWGTPEVIRNSNLMFKEDSFEDLERSYKFAISNGFQPNDYDRKCLVYEHRKLINFFMSETK